MDRDPKISFTRKAKGLGLAFLGALSIGFAGDAGAQNAPRRSWEYGDMSPADAEYCRRAAERETRTVREGGLMNGGNLCASDDVSPEIYALDLRRRERARTTESPADRARREAAQAKTMKESDELSRYCESVNYAGERCRGL